MLLYAREEDYAYQIVYSCEYVKDGELWEYEEISILCGSYHL